jgi:hypothetical protein
MYTEGDIESEAQRWERYVEEYCFLVGAIDECYGHIEGFEKLVRGLFDARQRAAARVCRALANIPVGWYVVPFPVS